MAHRIKLSCFFRVAGRPAVGTESHHRSITVAPGKAEIHNGAFLAMHSSYSSGFSSCSGSQSSETGIEFKGNPKSIEGRDAAVERLREFLRLNYMTGVQAARWIGVRAKTLVRDFRATANQILLNGSPLFWTLCQRNASAMDL